MFSKTTARKHSSLALSLLYGPTLMSIHDYWKNHSFDYADLSWQSSVSAFDMLSRFVIAFLPIKQPIKPFDVSSCGAREDS